MGAKVPIPTMLRSWKLKAQLQRMLAQLPVPVGDRVYHFLQTAKGLAPNPRRNIEFVERIASLAERARGTPLRQGTFVELGSGWFPTTPLTLLARGYARSVHTFDLNEHYSARRIGQAATALSTLLPGSPMLGDVGRTMRLPPSITYYPHVDIADAPLPAGSVDVAFSEFVLEHVTEKDLLRIHAAAHQWLREDGLWIHWISPGDHRAYSDTTLHPVDFLRYSREEWEQISGNRFAYHNRLRRHQFRALFQRAGWRIVFEDASIGDKALATLPHLSLHEDFRGVTAEDLVAGSLWFVLAKSRAPVDRG